VTTRLVRNGTGDGDLLAAEVRRIEQEMGLSRGFPGEVERTAEEAAEEPTLPARDRTDLPLVTVDPPGARDLDQAMHLRRDGAGYVVHYAIADVAAFVRPGDAVDVEAHRRGETLYGPDGSIPLHPPVLSAGAASLRPDQVRPALLWTIRLDSSGEGVDVEVQRALVRSRAQLDYVGVQRRIDSGTSDETLSLLREIGVLRVRREQVRGGVNLSLPEQEVVVEGDRWSLRHRARLPVEEWNAQLSLLTGMAAAHLMMYAEVGVLRTLPAADPRVLQRLHRTAAGLDIVWPAEVLFHDFVRGLDGQRPEHAAMLTACTEVLRGAGYVGFEDAVPEHAEHAALASEYAHVTAPLRRLVDRYGLEVCVSLCEDREVPDWVRARLSELPAAMEESARRAGRYENAVLDVVEAGVLAPHVGHTFTGVVTEVARDDPRKGWVVLREPAIEARVHGDTPLPLGRRVPVRLVEADVEQRSVRFHVDAG
jgi:exoribonuclease R